VTITARQLLSSLDEVSSLSEDKVIGYLAEIEEDHLLAAQSVNYSLYSKLIDHIFSENYTKSGLKSIIFEDYMDPFRSQIGKPISPEEKEKQERAKKEKEKSGREVNKDSDKSKDHGKEIEPDGEVSQDDVEEPPIVNSRSGQFILDVFIELRDMFKYVWDELKIDLAAFGEVFKDKSIYSLLKAFGFSLWSMFKCLVRFAICVKRGVFRVFQELYESGFITDLKRGLVSVDKVISEKPILKKLTGVSMAGFLTWVKLHHLLAEQPKYANTVTVEKIMRSLGGQYTIRDFLASPSALLIDVLAIVGLGSFLSVNWLATGVYAVSLVIVVICLKMMGKDTNRLESKIEYDTA
jgi:hypothetical protein